MAGLVCASVSQDPKTPESEMRVKFDKLNDEIAAAFDSLSD